tara:strand:- start:4060 stop:4959 length:900 start_codon:yes stop_codon:yes gene_type:complete
MLKTKLLDELMENIDKDPPSTPEIYDIVLDSGANNGGYLVGCLLYLKELEKKKYIKIRKISGSSIGSICAFFYMCDHLELYDDIYSNTRNDIINNLSLKKSAQMLKTFFNGQKDDFYLLFNNKLYISYYDIIKKCDIVVNNFKSNKDLYLKLRYSTFLPLFIDGRLSMNNKTDAGIPHIFYEDNKVLFINLTTVKKFTTQLNLSTKNSMYKILHGIIDIHQFYTTGLKTELCSYVNSWTTYEVLIFKLRVLCLYIVKFILSYLIELKTHYETHNEEYKANLFEYIASIIRNYILLPQNF